MLRKLFLGLIRLVARSVVLTTSDGVNHNYCMTLGTIALFIYFAAVGYVFYYMIRKDFFDDN